MDKNKVISYIGFAVKSGAAVIGGDNIEKSKKPLIVVLVCDSASDRLKKNMRRFGGKTEVIAVENLEQISKIGGCKALAITDKSLAEAVIQQLRGSL